MRGWALLLGLVAGAPLMAQSGAPIVHHADELAQHEAKLMAAAKVSPDGLAWEQMNALPNAQTLMVVRVKTGPAERHQMWADQIVMLKGSATLVTGPAMQGEKPAGTPGESTGAGVQGNEVELHAGDIARVTPGVPHWVKVPAGQTVTYLIFKER